MRKKCRGLVFLCMILISLVWSGTQVCAGSTDSKRVLFISSYSYGWDTVQIQIEGIKSGLDEDVVLDYEFMDTKRVDDEDSRKLFYNGLAYRMSKVESYDVIILGDDAALKFALEYRDELFDGVPLVFEGVNDEKLAMEAAQDPLISGVIEKLSFQKNIDLALTLYPEANKVVGILDDTLTGQAEREKFYQNAEQYPNLEFAEINTSQLSSDQLKTALSRIQNNTILIYVVMTEDASGKQYTNQESIELICQFASVPAFRMVEGGIGQGLLGGNVASMEQSGKLAAGLAMNYINGIRDSQKTGTVLESPNIYCIDEQVMKEYEISMSLLPEGTVIVNHEPDFFERNEEALRMGSVLGIALLVIVGLILIDNIRNRKMAKTLETTRHYLENASQHDFLTGLPNRSKFMEDLDNVMTSGAPCTIIMVDVDNFKRINDNYGHIVGDEALRQVADRLHKLATPLLTPYRYAGDEFIIIIRSSNRQIVDKSVFQCSQAFKKEFDLLGNVMPISGSIGVASYPEDTKEKEQLIVCADAAMYEVKKSGKNAFVYYRDIKDKDIKKED